MQVNQLRREIAVKIVYYGPPYSGKTTNLERLFATVDPARRSQLTSMKNQEDRTVFFDYMQIEMGKIGGLTPRFNLYTVPGQVMYEATRHIVLRGADAIIFVVDSAADRLAENLNSWRQLKQQLAALSPNSAAVPIIVQWNKRDVANALPIEQLKCELQITTQPSIEAQAMRDIGTRETLKAAITSVLGNKG
jgi:hypothetical protein